MVLRCVRYDVDPARRFYFTEMSAAQFLRLMDPTLRMELKTFSGTRGKRDWLDVHALPRMSTAGQLLDYMLGNQDVEIFDVEWVLGGTIAASCHDDGEITLQAPTTVDLRCLARAVLESRNVEPDAIIVAAEGHPGCYVAIASAGGVLGIHGTFDNYLKTRE